MHEYHFRIRCRGLIDIFADRIPISGIAYIGMINSLRVEGFTLLTTEGGFSTQFELNQPCKIVDYFFKNEAYGIAKSSKGISLMGYRPVYS